MAERIVQVSERAAELIGWMNAKGIDEVRKMIREHLAALKEAAEKNPAEKNGWDPVLEPNDGVDQWKHGGDCNMCRKADYCVNKCRANKTLKKITTPMLTQAYLQENPDKIGKESLASRLQEAVVAEAGGTPQ